MMQFLEVRKIAFVGSYFPRRCGIATFTHDLARSIAARHPGTERVVIPVTDPEQQYDYGPEARFEVDEQSRDAYRRAADFLNLTRVDVVSLQHEFGIYGGPAGSYVATLLRELDAPVVTTLHTILDDPSPQQDRVLREIISLSARLVVMSARGQALLTDLYDVPEAKVDVIPHGVPDMPFADSTFYKDQYGVEGKQVLLTFGLLAPNKGIESVLRALPPLVRDFPDLVYVVVGATHPNLVREQGEAYRLSLIRLAEDLGVRKHVVFFDRFVELDELLCFIGAADIFITPYLNPKQITSGVLAYAFGCGKPVISTPYWHAEELLADERGVLVPFGDSGAIAAETAALLRDEARRNRMRKRAYLLSRESVWSNAAQRYVETFAAARRGRAGSSRGVLGVKTLDQRSDQLPRLRLDHLMRMTDGVGLFQHAAFVVPRRDEGYCTDDNARALLLTVLLENSGLDSTEVRRLASTYAAFVNHAFDAETRRFRNFMSLDHRWIDPSRPDDAHGRALRALGAVAGRSRQLGLRRWAARLFAEASSIVLESEHPRDWAFALLGVHDYFRRLQGDSAVERLRTELTNRLLTQFDLNASGDWRWFSERLTYDNAVLPHALVLSGGMGEDPRAIAVGLESLRWLCQVQQSEAGRFRPIGSNGFCVRGGKRAQFDQQPLEAQATVAACAAACATTSDPFWLVEARRAFDWFLGRNDLDLELYDPTTGGCRDGLAMDRTNENQGAESTLAFLLSLSELTQLEASLVEPRHTGERPPRS
ncbi:MAG: glycosyltransferase family 4 protein [Polyangiaceae bacterium]|nr:glycosyltransferase family 4 protein [Polyangiaceae bacterium]